MLWLLTFVFMKEDNSMDINDPFECGLEAFYVGRYPLRMHFFLIGIMFLVFDIEFVISLPLIIMSVNLVVWLFLWIFLMSLLVLVLMILFMLLIIDGLMFYLIPFILYLILVFNVILPM
nr:NADH dehydrogenase subunit 3 [Halipeurus diversus]